MSYYKKAFSRRRQAGKAPTAPLREEKYDFLIPKDKMEKPAVKKFLEVLRSAEFKDKLKDTAGLKTSRETGSIIYPHRARI